MTPTDTITRAAINNPKSFAITVSGISLTVLLGIFGSIWHFTTKVALAENQTKTNKTEIVLLKGTVERHTNIITAVDKMQAVMQADIEYIKKAVQDLKTDQKARDIEQRIRDEKIMEKLESLKK